MPIIILFMLSSFSKAANISTIQSIDPFLPSRSVPTVSPLLEEHILDLFSHGDCDQIRKSIPSKRVMKLRPLIKSVVAYCEFKGVDSEALFSSAEEEAPSNEFVFFLHARYRWKINPKSAEALFRRTVLIARNPVVRKMARDYLNGTSNADEPFFSHHLSFYMNTQLGIGRETNPAGTSMSGNVNPSNVTGVQTSISALKPTNYGSLGVNYSLFGSFYSGLHETSLLSQSLILPFSFRAGKREDIILRPFFNYSEKGSRPYQLSSGLGIRGTSYRSEYRESVQGSIFFDRNFPAALSNQDGTHFRFEYLWDFFPSKLFLRFNAFIEHTTASHDENLDPDNFFSIPYSHNDLGVQVFADYDLSWFILGIYPKFSVRIDDQQSRYLSSDNTRVISKGREEYTYGLQLNMVVPLENYLQFVTWYEWTRIYSNLGVEDYTDRNVQNQTVGVALRTFLASY